MQYSFSFFISSELQTPSGMSEGSLGPPELMQHTYVIGNEGSGQAEESSLLVELFLAALISAFRWVQWLKNQGKKHSADTCPTILKKNKKTLMIKILYLVGLHGSCKLNLCGNGWLSFILSHFNDQPLHFQSGLTRRSHENISLVEVKVVNPPLQIWHDLLWRCALALSGSYPASKQNDVSSLRPFKTNMLPHFCMYLCTPTLY